MDSHKTQMIESVFIKHETDIENNFKINENIPDPLANIKLEKCEPNTDEITIEEHKFTPNLSDYLECCIKPELPDCAQTTTAKVDEPQIENIDVPAQKEQDVNHTTSNNIFTCDTCSKTFKRLYNYEKHLETHSNINDNKNNRLKINNKNRVKIINKCIICSRTFLFRQTLERHVKLHLAESPQM